mmetsp:Transcript_4637/g.13205  ORF Transcript_4637/g.13205 Transcript_4637/m.13205 type:complete len:408 (-) Transcript_4637:35-1258(-)
MRKPTNTYTLLFSTMSRRRNLHYLRLLEIGQPLLARVRALAGSPLVLALGRIRTRLERLDVQGLHLGHGELAALALAEVQHGQLNGSRPGEGEVPGLVGLRLVHGGEARAGVLEALATREVVDRRDGHGHAAARHLQVRLGDLLHGEGRRAIAARVHHVGLEHGALHEHAVLEHGLVEHGLHGNVHVHGRLEVVDALERDIRLDDGHEALVLRDEREAREVLHVGFNGERRRAALAHIDLQRRAPLGEAAASGVVVGAARGQGVQALHHGVATGARERVHLKVRLNARHDAALLQHLREGLTAGGGLLEHRLDVKDGAAEVLLRILSLEEHLAVHAAVLLRVLDAHSLEAGADGAGALVAGRDALARGGDGLGRRHKLRLALGAQVLAIVNLQGGHAHGACKRGVGY